MNRSLSARLLGGALTAAAGAGTAMAQTPPAASYVITSIGSTAAGNTAAHELLTLRRSGAQSRVALAEPDGTVVSLPVTFTADGAIASRSADGGITCYNMAMDVLARDTPSPAAPATVLLRFGASVVPVPLALRAVETQGMSRTVALAGTSSGTFDDGTTTAPAGAFVSAAVQTDGGGLRGAVFDEIRYVGSRENVVGRSTCMLQRAERAAPTKPA